MSINNASLGEAVLDLSADDSQMRKDMEGAKTSALRKMKDMGRSMTRMGQSMTVAFTLPLLALGGFAVNAASDLEENKNKATVVFGEMADSVIENAGRADEALGLSQKQYLDYASAIQAALTAGGMGVAESAALAERAVQHYADLASFHNAETEDVATAWQSAIRGQYEPIQRYFPFITNEYLKTYGIANGMLDENVENLTANQRAVILNAIALDETLNPALDDFAETSDGAANQMRILKAQSANAAATLGLQLLPYAVKFMELLSGLITRFQALTPEQQKWVVIIGAVVAAAGPLLMIVGGLITGITAIAGVVAAISTPVLVVIAVIAALIAIGYLLYQAWTKNWGGIQDKVAVFTNYWKGTLLPAIQNVWGWMSGTLFPFLRALGNFIGAVLNVVLKAMAGIWQKVLLPALTGVATMVAARLMPSFTKLAEFFRGTLLPIVREIAKWIGETLAGAFSKLTNVMAGVTGTLNTLASGLNNIELPAWMTPGSPTPWEIGLLGVADALKQVSNLGLPRLDASLGNLGTPMAATAGGGAGGGNTFYAPVTFAVNDAQSFDELMRTLRSS